MFRRTLALAVGILVAAALSTSAHARVLKINESLPSGSVEGDALRMFKQIVEERTNGELEINLHFQDELGAPQTSMENLGTGTLELYSGALSYYAALIPEELGVTTLMYFFQDNAHLQRYLKGGVFQKGHQKLIDDFGIRFISTEFLGDRGPYRVFASTEPVTSVDDIDGIKMRLWPNDMAIRAWSHLGAVPTVMPWNDVYLSLRQGVVSAVTSGVNGLHDSKMTEVAPYVVVLRQFPQTWPITISEEIWQSLSAEHQQVLVDAANEATAYYGEISHSMAEENIANMIKTNGAVWTRIDTAPFAEKMQSFYESLIDEGVLSQEIFDEVTALRQ